MAEWIANGSRLAWMIDTVEKMAVIYRSDGSSERKDFGSILSGEDVIPGFEFDLKMLE
jgi:hypothetical protein